ncbi:MAG: Cu-binding protein [Bogoriella megaspora]|nr:MAG: Cu-binding protein [Bogoriella megaspora]
MSRSCMIANATRRAHHLSSRTLPLQTPGAQATGSRSLFSHALRCTDSSSSNDLQRCRQQSRITNSDHSRRAHKIPAARSFSSTPRRPKVYKTVEQAKARNRLGPFSWPAAALFLLAGIGMTFYFRSEKERMQRKRIAEMTKGIGKPKVGGPFELVDHNGNKFTDKDLAGKYALVYFGFTHCPDICPEELDKMAGMIDRVKERSGNTVRPIVISCDPARDTPQVLKKYLSEFHPDMIGLTGDYEQVKAACKAYRVYFSTPKDVKPGQDYLVDHSIYFYLMDPEGDFVEAIGRQFSAESAAKLISDHVGDWKGKLDKD